MKHLLCLMLLLLPSGAHAADRLTFTAAPDRTTAYIGESITYTAALTTSAAIFDLTLTPPQISGTRVEQVSDDILVFTTLNGVPARTLKRFYILTPQQYGEETITPPRLTAVIAKENAAANLPLTSQIEHVTRTADSVPLTILPRPADWGSDTWLPAQNLTLSVLSRLPEVGQVGEPITYRLELIATGLDAALLPALTPPTSEAFKIYANPPVRENFIDENGRLFGHLVQEFNLIPLIDGTFNLPTPTVVWFNTTLHQKEIATTEPIPITVYPTTAATAPTFVHPVLPPLQALHPAPMSPQKTVARTADWVRVIDKIGSMLGFLFMAVIGIFTVAFMLSKKKKSKKRLPDLYPY